MKNLKLLSFPGYIFMSMLALIISGNVFAADHASVAADSVKILNAIDASYQPLQNQWYGVIKTYAQRLFWILVLIDLSWSGIIYALEKNDIAEIATSFLKKLITIGFFWSLLKLSDTWIPTIIKSFVQIGTDAGKIMALSPDEIIYKGADIALGVFAVMNKMGMLDALATVIPLTLIAIIIFICFTFVAIQLLVTLVESYIAIGAGVILLGFGGSRWTTDFATKYLQYAVGTGLKLMILYLILGAGQAIFANGALIDHNNVIPSSFAALGTGLIYAFLAYQVPQIASSMMSGSPALTAGGALGAAVTMGATMAGAAAASASAAQTAGSAGVGMAASGTGVAKALGAGYGSGVDAGKSGMDAAAHAVGEVGKHGMGLASNTLGEAVGTVKDNFAGKVDSSAGGKIATSINEGRGGASSPSPVPAPPPILPGGGNSNGGNVLHAGGGKPANSPSSTGADAVSGVGGGIAGTQADTATPNTSKAAGASGASASSGTASTSNAQSESVSAPIPANGNNLGDASNASLNAGGDTSTAAQAQPGNPREALAPQEKKAPLHDRINQLQGFVPNDSASGATIQINLGHTQD